MNKLKTATLTVASIFLLSGCGAGTDSAPEPSTVTATVTETAAAPKLETGGSIQAVRYLDGKQIIIEPEMVEAIAEIVCGGLADGGTGSGMVKAVEGGIGMSRLDAAEVVSAATVYICPDHIGKLPR